MISFIWKYRFSLIFLLFILFCLSLSVLKNPKIYFDTERILEMSSIRKAHLMFSSIGANDEWVPSDCKLESPKECSRDDASKPNPLPKSIGCDGNPASWTGV